MDIERVLIIALCLVALLNLGVAWIWKREAERWQRLATLLQQTRRVSARPAAPAASNELFSRVMNDDGEQTRTAQAVRKLLRFSREPSPAPATGEEGKTPAGRT
jgi:hypothetical protein